MKNKTLLVALAFAAFTTSCKKQSGQEAPLADAKQNDCNCTVEQAFPEIKGQVISFGNGAKKISLTKKNDQFILGGDILLSNDQVSFLKQKADASGASTESTFVDYLNRRWTDGIVYYAIDTNVPNQARINDAIAHWKAKTKLTFTVRTNQANYIRFVVGSGCSSSLGMIGGAQKLNLSSGCSTGNAIHEIGHALGLLHEQSRTDRDDYVIINKDNIEAGYEHNFDTWADRGYTGGQTGAFDFGSIMMYPSSAFSSNGEPTITKLDGSTFGSQRTALSVGDLAGFKYLYPNYAL